jgi:hypothetical protein
VFTKHGKDKKCLKNQENLKGIYHLEKLIVYRKIMEIWILGNKKD